MSTTPANKRDLEFKVLRQRRAFASYLHERYNWLPQPAHCSALVTKFASATKTEPLQSHKEKNFCFCISMREFLCALTPNTCEFADTPWKPGTTDTQRKPRIHVKGSATEHLASCQPPVLGILRETLLGISVIEDCIEVWRRFVGCQGRDNSMTMECATLKSFFTADYDDSEILFFCYLKVNPESRS
ncbi:unnamed protein product [Cylicocyclus nassatus]|uniref:Uncharacterized protein n=1 Tax=Cylicocyclus nassatus TaxID=53992 RepID=A0AA36H9U1_CYLNA|nr:unnamed protein product [Cylicocyclus nassatus]